MKLPFHLQKKGKPNPNESRETGRPPQTRGRLLKTKLAEISLGRRRKRLSKIGMFSDRGKEERWADQLLPYARSTLARGKQELRGGTAYADVECVRMQCFGDSPLQLGDLERLCQQRDASVPAGGRELGIP